jgi:geranylgeranyl reductase family protein
MYDVIVIGAGPSGLNAAKRLAEGGLNVVVLEKKSEIGIHTVCTGIVGKEAFRGFDLSRDSILMEIKKIKMVSPFGSFLIYQHPTPFAYVVDREKFDKYLADIAQLKGVEIELKNQVMDISVNKNYVEVLTKVKSKCLRKYSAKIAIIATGIDYKLNKKLGLGYPKDFLNGVQAELEIGNVDSTTVFVGKNIAPGAFAWVVPIGEETVRIGLMTVKDPKVCFQHLMEKLYPKKMKDLDKKRIQFKAIAQGLISKTYGDRVLAVGEAAGQVKTTTGGGIYFGLLCSEIASQVVLKRFEEGCFSAKALAEYEKLWKNAIKKEILIGYYTRKICGKLSDFQIEKMFQIAQSDGIIPLIKDKGNFDWHSELIISLMKRIPLLKLISIIS